MAAQAVWTHRFRSLLTILGIVIGITTVVTVASLLSGLRQGVVTFFEELGPDNIFLYRTSGDPSMQAPPKERKRRALSPDYVASIRMWCPSLADVGLELYIPPVVNGQPITVRVPGYESDTINVAGYSPNMDEISPRDFTAGRSFTAEEDMRGAHVAAVGANVADSLFPAGDAVGRTVMMDGAEYTIIGVYAKAKGGFFGGERDGQRRGHPAAHGAEPLPAGGPLYDHLQGAARQAAGGVFGGGVGHAAPAPPAHRGRERFLDLHAGPDHPAVRPD